MLYQLKAKSDVGMHDDKIQDDTAVNSVSYFFYYYSLPCAQVPKCNFQMSWLV